MTYEELKSGRATLITHINFGDGYGYIYRSVVEPRLTIHVSGPKGRKSKRLRSTIYAIAGDDRDFTTLEEAFLELQKLDKAMADESEWDAAAPKKTKPAAIQECLP